MSLAIGICASDAMCLWGRPFAGSKTLAPSCAWMATVARISGFREPRGLDSKKPISRSILVRKVRNYFKHILDRLLTNQSLENLEILCHRTMAVVSTNLVFGEPSYIAPVAVKTPLNICYSKIKN